MGRGLVKQALESVERVASPRRSTTPPGAPAGEASPGRAGIGVGEASIERQISLNRLMGGRLIAHHHREIGRDIDIAAHDAPPQPSRASAAISCRIDKA